MPQRYPQASNPLTNPPVWHNHPLPRLAATSHALPPTKKPDENPVGFRPVKSAAPIS